MESLKDNLLKLTKLIIIITTVAGTISAIIFTCLHIKMFPIEIIFYPQEIILLICMVILFLFTNRYKMKYLKNIGAAGIFLGMINLVGFKIIIKLLMRG